MFLAALLQLCVFFVVIVPSFPVDWKTVELPLNDTFQPCFALVTSPSLFYLLAPNQG